MLRVMQPGYPQQQYPDGQYPQQQQAQQPWQQPQNGMVPMGQGGLAVGALNHPRYQIKRPFFSIGRKFWVHAPDGSLAMFVKHPIFKMKPEFTICADERETMPMITVRSRTVVALNRIWDVTDARTGERVGALRSRGLKSILRDTWDILDPNDQPAGLVQEDSLAILRRFFPILLGKWHVELQGAPVATIKQNFKFFAKEYTLDLSMGQGRIDARFAIACAMLALMAETAREAAK